MVQPRISTENIINNTVLINYLIYRQKLESKFVYKNKVVGKHTWSSQAKSLLKMMAAPRLLAGLMPVPVIGIVAKWTKNTANPMGRGAKIYNPPKKNNHIEIRVRQALRN